MAVTGLERLYLDHGPALHLYLRHRLRDPDVASDLVHDAFVRLAQVCDQGQVINSRAYLFRIGHNLVVDHVRRLRRHRTEAMGMDQMALLEGQTAQCGRCACPQQELAEVHDIVEHLPARTRRIFCLAKLEGLTHAEAAVAAGVSESSVQKHLAMAVAHVQQHYGCH